MSTDTNTTYSAAELPLARTPAPAIAGDTVQKPSPIWPTTPDNAERAAEVTVESLRDLLQGAGYRVDVVREGSLTYLRSATNGLAFDVRFGNGLSGASERVVDLAFVALFGVQGALPLDLLNRWNQTRRYGRLFLDQPAPDRQFLVFCMDVSVTGATTAQLRTHLGIWDSLIQQLIPWLREEIGKIAPIVDTSTGASGEATTASAETPPNGIAAAI